MINFTQKDLEEAYGKSSFVIRKILEESWPSDNAAMVAKSMGLRVDKIEIVIKLTGLVLMNLVPLSKLVSTLESELSVDNTKAIAIAEKMDQYIFKKVREEVKITDKILNSSGKEIQADPLEKIMENKELDLRKTRMREEIKEAETVPIKEDRRVDLMSGADELSEPVVKKSDPYRENFGEKQDSM